MNTKDGWVKFHRQLRKKAFYKKSSYIHLWVELLLLANYEEAEVLWNGKIIKLRPGQFITGRKELSENTRIPESTIERILTLFENEHQIEQQKNNKFRLITILNWSEYQGNGQQDEQPTDNKGTADEQPADTDNNTRTISIYKKDFYECYPHFESDVFKNTYDDYLLMRKKKGRTAVVTKRAEELILNKLQAHKLADAIKMLENSIEGGWTGVFPLKPPEEEFKKGKRSGIVILHDGTQAIWKYGKWVDARDNQVEINVGYYKELNKY